MKEKLSFKELDKLLKEAVNEYSASLFFDKGLDFSYDHYCSEVQTVFILESSDSPVEVEYEKLVDLEEAIKKISPRIQLSIIHESEDFGNTKD